MSFSTQADAAVVFARTGSPGGGSRGVSAFFVELNQKGITARISTISVLGDGTAQIQKLVIAREKVGRIALQYEKLPGRPV